jgi:hypothetical protein
MVIQGKPFIRIPLLPVDDNPAFPPFNFVAQSDGDNLKLEKLPLVF